MEGASHEVVETIKDAVAATPKEQQTKIFREATVGNSTELVRQSFVLDLIEKGALKQRSIQSESFEKMATRAGITDPWRRS
jgi:hypothetical protein